MKVKKMTVLVIVAMFLLVACSGVSPQLKSTADKRVPFRTLVSNPNAYAGKTVILGGYIQDAKVEGDKSIITVLQAPLAFWDRPKSKIHSEGRFVISHTGPLKAVAYMRDNELTVVGKVVGYTKENISGCPSPCLKIASSQIFVWRKIEYDRSSPYDDFDAWDNPYPSAWD